LRKKTYRDDICLYRCDVCAGLWVKPDALEKMKNAWMAEAVLDIGDPQIGNDLNDVDDIDCPEGHGKMFKTEDLRQQHIWFEQCLTCHGVFLDAGEFTDLKYETLLDFVRGMLKGSRPAD
jgi:Zn-finger nucleic acid-binding protein